MIKVKFVATFFVIYCLAFFVICSDNAQPTAEYLSEKSHLHALYVQNQYINLYEKNLPATVTIAPSEN